MCRYETFPLCSDLVADRAWMSLQSLPRQLETLYAHDSIPRVFFHLLCITKRWHLLSFPDKTSVFPNRRSWEHPSRSSQLVDSWSGKLQINKNSTIRTENGKSWRSQKDTPNAMLNKHFPRLDENKRTMSFIWSWICDYIYLWKMCCKG